MLLFSTKTSVVYEVLMFHLLFPGSLVFLECTFAFLSACVWDIALYSLGLSDICYAASVGLGFMIFLTLLSTCWDHRKHYCTLYRVSWGVWVRCMVTTVNFRREQSTELALFSNTDEYLNSPTWTSILAFTTVPFHLRNNYCDLRKGWWRGTVLWIQPSFETLFPMFSDEHKHKWTPSSIKLTQQDGQWHHESLNSVLSTSLWIWIP